MQIGVTVTLDDDDNFAYTADAGALQVLVALGGDQTKDFCSLTIQQHALGNAGTEPAPPTGAA